MPPHCGGAAAGYLVAIAIALALIGRVPPAIAQDAELSPCTEDAMLVFDASGSMSSKDWGRAAGPRTR
jgi:hypothetical protein